MMFRGLKRFQLRTTRPSNKINKMIDLNKPQKELEKILLNLTPGSTEYEQVAFKIRSIQLDTNNIQIANLTEEMRILQSSLKKYSNSANNEGKRMYRLTIFLGFIALLQLYIGYKQMIISENQGISEKIMQAKNIQSAIELCSRDSMLKESGLFEISTGKPAPCEIVLQTYTMKDSIWYKIKRFLIN